MDAQIRVTRGGFKWEQDNIAIKDLDKEQIGKWLESEKRKLKMVLVNRTENYR